MSDATDTPCFFSESEDKPMVETRRSNPSRSTVFSPPLSDFRSLVSATAACGGGVSRGSTPPPHVNDFNKRQRTDDAAPASTNDSGSTDGADKTFRMNAKSFWITYPALYRGELTHDRILSMLLSKGALAEYSIGREHHKEEKVAELDRDEHFHVYVVFEAKKNIKSCRYFDMRSDGTYQSRVLHPNFVANKTKEDRINRVKYTMKEDPNPLQKLNGPLGLAMSKAEMYHALNNVTSKEEGMTLVKENCPEEYFKHGDAIERRLDKLFGGFVAVDHDLSTFRGIQEGESPKLDLSKPVVLWGKSGKAKTDFAMAQGKYPLLVDEIDKMKESNSLTDVWVLDDMNFGPSGLNWTPEQLIRLLDTKKPRTIKARYSNAQRPAHMKLIFLTNLVPPEVTEAQPNFLADQFPDMEATKQDTGEWIFPRGRNEEQDVAIRRRYRLVGPVTRMLATPASSWARLAKEATEKYNAAHADDSETGTTLSRASTIQTHVTQLLSAARDYRGMPPKTEAAEVSFF